MYITQGDRIAWPEHDISVPVKYLPILQCKAAGWSWKAITQRYCLKTANPSGARDLLITFFKHLPEFASAAAFTYWLQSNGISPIDAIPNLHNNGRGIIYCFGIPEHPRLVKIGMAYERTFNSRMQSFSTSYPKIDNRKNSLLAIEWTIPDMVKAYEKRLQREFSSSRINGSEWFELSPPVINWLKRCSPDALLEAHSLLSNAQQALYLPVLF